ncbi:MAG: bifunctional riboflavin kinase/FAD synthetase [Eubacteriales bacterium]|jgi:riboflavin kinase/FMN adenylyltransferase
MDFLQGNNSRVPADKRPTAVALGFFDGVHRGHQQIIGTMLEQADKLGLTPVVHTFLVSPRVLLGKAKVAYQITSMEEKLDILERMSVEIVAADDFSPEYRSMSPEEFVEKVLIDRLGARAVVAGFHYHFGKNGAGDADLLRRLCRQRGVECTIVQRIAQEGETISSTHIRELIEEGQIQQANELLGHPYFVIAEVVRGKQFGRTIGFPTINQNIKEHSIVIKKGVYITRVLIDGQWFLGITNVGRRPSVEANGRENIETYIFDVDADLYGRSLKVEFLRRLRDEQKFASGEELQAQIARDKAYTLQYMEELGHREKM